MLIVTLYNWNTVLLIGFYCTGPDRSDLTTWYLSLLCALGDHNGYPKELRHCVKYWSEGME